MEIVAIKSKAYKGILDQKTYVLSQGDEVVIIDAGADTEDVKEVVQNKKVLAVLLTHLHFDHIYEIEGYLKEWNMPVYIAPNAEDKFGDFMKNCSYIFRTELVFNVPQKNIKYYAEKLKIGSFEIDVFFTPGHSQDSVCLLINKNLFCGDLVLGGTIGRTDLYDSSFIQMKSSLEKLEYIDFEMAYPGHYEAMTKQEVLNCF